MKNSNRMDKSKVFAVNIVSLFLFLNTLVSGINRDFDVLHYEIYIDLYAGLVQRNGFYSGYVKIKLVTNKNLDEVRIHASSSVIQIDSVLWLNYRLNFQHNLDTLKIIFPFTVSPGETLTFTIYYRRESTIDRGFYFYRSDEFNLPSDIAYTMTEPSDSKYWFPCYDEPWDKATVDIAVKVRKNFLVASNGLLFRDEINGDERIFYWSSRYPMSTYLIAFAASEYITFSDWYRKVSNPNDSIEIKYYVWHVDSIKAIDAFKTVPDMMRFFATKFGEYPFEKYGMVAVYPFQYGGMEHQTMTTINRGWLYGNYEGGIAHELAHQWWGDLVTCENWAEIWLNEGFASYSDALYTEYKYGRESFKSKLRNWANYYFAEDSIIRYPIYNPPPQKLFGTAVYLKGAWVLHMLRNLTGDSLFFSILQEWGRRFAYSVGTTQQFIQVVNDITGENYDWFFDQWVYDSGYPIFDICYSTDPENLTIHVRQVQKGARIFRVTLEFRIQAQEVNTLVTFQNYTADTTYSVALGGLNVTKIDFDPGEKILKKVISITFLNAEISNSLPSHFNLYQNYPNPFNGLTRITFEVGSSDKIYDCEIVIFDVFGRMIKKLFNGKIGSGKHSLVFDASGMASGVYFYELRIFDNGIPVYRRERKMVLLK